MIKYECCGNNQINEIIEFVKNIDREFPVKLSSLVNIDEYIKKLINFGSNFIVRDDNKIIGICSGYMNDNKNYNAYISLLGVDSKYRNMGIATELVNLFIKKSIENKMKRVYLETDKENFSAIKFYEKNYFTKLEEVKPNTIGSIVLMRVLEN